MKVKVIKMGQFEGQNIFIGDQSLEEKAAVAMINAGRAISMEAPVKVVKAVKVKKSKAKK